MITPRQLAACILRPLGISALCLLAASAVQLRPSGSAYSGSAQALQKAARAAVAAAQAGPAMAALEAALKQTPDWKEGLWDYGTLLYQARQFPAAQVRFARLSRLDPQHGAPWAMLGLCDFELRDFGSSLDHLQEGRSLGLPNQNLEEVALYTEAQDLLVLDEFAQATHLLKAFALHHRPSPGIVAALGLAALHLPLLPATYKVVLEPRRQTLVERMGEEAFLFQGDDKTKAQTAMTGILRDFPSAAYVHFNAGLLREALNDLPAARTEFLQELKIDADNVPDRLELAALDADQDHMAEGLAQARAAERLDPQSFATHYVVGYLYFRQQQWQAAAQELQQSEALQPADSQVRYTLAQVYLRLHRNRDALREEQAFRRLAPLASSLRLKGVLPASVYLDAGSPKNGN